MEMTILLKEIHLNDAARVAELLSDGVVARTTSTIPLVYGIADAQRWVNKVITSSPAAWHRAIKRPDSPDLLGIVSLVEVDYDCANLAYWIGVRYWGQGIATAAAVKAVTEEPGSRYGHLIASHLSNNPASGRVLIKAGFTPVGTSFRRWRGGDLAALVDYRIDR